MSNNETETGDGKYAEPSMYRLEEYGGNAGAKRENPHKAWLLAKGLTFEGAPVQFIIWDTDAEQCKARLKSFDRTLLEGLRRVTPMTFSYSTAQGVTAMPEALSVVAASGEHNAEGKQVRVDTALGVAMLEHFAGKPVTVVLEHIKELAARLEIATTTAEHLGNGNEAAAAELESLRAQLNGSEQARDALRVRNDEAKRQIAELEKELVDERLKVEHWRKQSSEHNERVGELEAEHLESQGECKAVTAHNKRLAEAYYLMQAKAEKLEARVKDLTEALAITKDNRDSYVQKARVAWRELEEANAKTVDAEQALDGLKNEYSAKAVRVQTLVAENVGLKQELEEARGGEREVDANNDVLRTELAKAYAELRHRTTERNVHQAGQQAWYQSFNDLLSKVRAHRNKSWIALTGILDGEEKAAWARVDAAVRAQQAPATPQEAVSGDRPSPDSPEVKKGIRRVLDGLLSEAEEAEVDAKAELDSCRAKLAELRASEQVLLGIIGTYKTGVYFLRVQLEEALGNWYNVSPRDVVAEAIGVLKDIETGLPVGTEFHVAREDAPEPLTPDPDEPVDVETSGECIDLCDRLRNESRDLLVAKDAEKLARLIDSEAIPVLTAYDRELTRLRMQLQAAEANQDAEREAWAEVEVQRGLVRSLTTKAEQRDSWRKKAKARKRALKASRDIAESQGRNATELFNEAKARQAQVYSLEMQLQQVVAENEGLRSDLTERAENVKRLLKLLRADVVIKHRLLGLVEKRDEPDPEDMPF